ncbi:hypothetical protein CNMCM5793_006347 [Aspergillus hiratsukae]|uniref:Uncharacterized protein n=1 Tax=Aspergillus hiratsukae TaxID=1194566 RepID=A0A8H6QHC8_9EURO|nr:hypothetical protein CNMCM5793_006347 [Aspergillus hiratsukae]KAF7173141.1 hypothetical protein CNMCM6106_007269 [Aspergillus hiratsukae]
MSLYTYQPELPHGLPTIAYVQGFPTPPDTPPNELEMMVQELSHGLPSLDTDIVMEEDTIDRMLIDDEPVPDLSAQARDDYDVEEVIYYTLSGYGITIEELQYVLVEYHVVIEYWGPNEHVAEFEQEGVLELWSCLLDDLLVDSATSFLAGADTAANDIVRFAR